jgi:uncharacterized Tic20 family protein
MMAPMETQTLYRSQSAGQWALLLHLSQFAGYVVPFAGWIAPILIWQLKKEEIPELDAHGRNVVNWILSELIYATVSVILIFVLIGIPMLIVLFLLGVIFPIIGGVKAADDIVWKYPLSLPFLRQRNSHDQFLRENLNLRPNSPSDSGLR